jgi:predicted nicotinamide N-methyase
VLLAADILYDSTARATLDAHLRKHLNAERRLLIADPERADEHKLDSLCSVERVGSGSNTTTW